MSKSFCCQTKRRSMRPRFSARTYAPFSTRLSSSRYRVLDIVPLSSTWCCLCFCLFVLSLLFMSLSQLVLVFQVVDDMSLFTPHEAEVWPMSLLPLVFSLSFPEWRLSRYPSPKNYNAVCFELHPVTVCSLLLPEFIHFLTCTQNCLQSTIAYCSSQCCNNFSF